MQLELALHAPPPPDLEEVARLAGWLHGAGDRWIKASEISAALTITDRQIRHLATSSGGIIVSSPGSPGYKHVRTAILTRSSPSPAASNTKPS